MTRRLVLFGLLLACFPSLSHAKGDRKILDITDFSQGLDSYHSPIALPKGFVQDSNNVLFDASGRVGKRQGYTVSWSTKSYQFNNLWTYTDASNTSWQLARSSDQITANNLGGTIVLVATVSANNIVGEVNAFGFAYFVDQTQGVYYWNGTSTTYVAGSPKGSIINGFHNRVWVTGQAVPNGNLVNGSKYLDGTTWTTGLNPNDPVQYTIGLQDNFDNVTALYVYLDTEYIFKHYAVYALYGFDQTSFQITQLTQECGCIDGNSIQTYEGGLKFMSLRGIENFNGYTCERISNPVKNKVDPAILVGGFNSQSWTQSQASDWNAGTLVQLSSTAAPPTLVISTQVAFSTTDFNWNASTAIVNLDSSTYAPNLSLSSTVPTNQNQNACTALTSGYDTFNPSCSGGTNQSVAQSFTTAGASALLSSVTIHLEPVDGASPPAMSTTLRIKSDNAGVPGTDLYSTSITYGSGATCSDFGVSVTPNLVLSPNTVYWIYIDGFNTNGGNAYMRWFTKTGNPYAGGNIVTNCGSNVTDTANDLEFSTVMKPVFVTTGSFISQTFNVGQSTNSFLWNWGAFTTNESDNGGTITYLTQVSSSVNGVWDAPVAVTPGGTIASATKQYIEYIASFTTVNVTTSPVLSSASINTSIMERSSGTFQSQIHNLGSINSFGNFPVTDTLNGGAIAFSICSSTSATMSGPGVTVSCANQTPNSQISVSTGTSGSSATYVQWYATFTVTNATQTPTLNSGTVQWFSGTPAQPMSSTIWDNRYWLSLTTSSIDSANDAVLVLNTRGAWAVFDIHAGGFTQYKGALYHADSRATGNIYLDNQGEADNGSSINAYINTRIEPLGNVAADDYLYAVYPSALNTGNCNMTTSYVVDSATNTFSLGTINLNEFGVQTVGKLPFPIDAAHQDFGQSVNFIIGTNDALCDWKFFGLTGIYRERPIN